MTVKKLISNLTNTFEDKASTKSALLNTYRIYEWLDQFPKQIHSFLLSETIYIFNHSYFSNKRVETLLSKFLLLLKEKEGKHIFDKITPMPVNNMKNKAHIEYCSQVSKIFSAKKNPRRIGNSDFPVYYYLNDFITDEELQREQILHFIDNVELSSSTRLYVFSITHDTNKNKQEWENLLLDFQEKYIDIVLTPFSTPTPHHSSQKAKLLFTKIEKEYGPKVNLNYNNFITYMGAKDNLASIFSSTENGWIPLIV